MLRASASAFLRPVRSSLRGGARSVSTRKNPWALPSSTTPFEPTISPKPPLPQADDSVSLGSLLTSLTSSARGLPPSSRPAHLPSPSRKPPPPPPTSLHYLPIAQRLIDSASSLEEAVDIATHYLRITQPSTSSSSRSSSEIDPLPRQLFNLLLEKLPFCPSLPSPSPLCSFFLTHQDRFQAPNGTWFNGNRQHPLTVLLEVYNRIYIQRRKILDPVEVDPNEKMLRKLEEMRRVHVDAVKVIEDALRQAGKGGKGEGYILARNVRSQVSVLSGYGQGGAYEDFDRVWEELTKEGGVGVDERALDVYFDACGFRGSLPLALSLWSLLDTPPFPSSPSPFSHLLPISPNTHTSYQECLVRLQAWPLLLSHLSSLAQRSSALSSNSSPPSSSSSASTLPPGFNPLTPSSLAGIVKLAKRMVIPRHARFGAKEGEKKKKVGWEDYDKLMEGLKEIVGIEGMEEVERVLARGRGGVKVDFKEGWKR